jgi:hypothetical protein
MSVRIHTLIVESREAVKLYDVSSRVQADLGPVTHQEWVHRVLNGAEVEGEVVYIFEEYKYITSSGLRVLQSHVGTDANRSRSSSSP